jgi:hypothetical protein
MGYVRLVKPEWYDHVGEEFIDYAFKRTASGGMSVFEVECAERTSQLICAHARDFHAGQTGDPPVFCFLEDAELPKGGLALIVDDPDPCHRDIDAHVDGKRIGNRPFKEHFRQKRHWSHFFICENGNYRPLTAGDVEGWKSKKAQSSGED